MAKQDHHSSGIHMYATDRYDSKKYWMQTRSVTDDAVLEYIHFLNWHVTK